MPGQPVSLRASAGASPCPVVLLVEDSATVRLIVRKALREFEVVEALDGPAGLAAAFTSVPDVVLLDRYLPGQDGLEILERLVADDRTRDVPVIFLTGDDDPATLVSALEGGAHDFVRKPFLDEELVARVRGAARLKRLGDELRLAASRDLLTGLLNRRAMLHELQQWTSRARRHNTAVAVLVADLSGFKRVNDEHGHAAGDEALIVVARLLQQAVRGDDTVGRWGGDEFVALLPHTDAVGARLVADRMVELVAGTAVSLPGGAQVRVGITVGVAAGPTDDDGVDMLNRADHDLYGQRGARTR